MIKSENGPVALHSELGWILSGPVPLREGMKPRATLVTHVLRVDTVNESKRLDQALTKFWDFESMGIVENESVVQTQFSDYVSYEGGRYVVSLPWKDSSMLLPDNYELCHKRLLSLIRRLKRTPDLLEKYDEVIREQLRLGIIVPVERERNNNAHRIHYIPHHAVVRYNKSTTKIRVVYDASAKGTGPSLNDCLHVGPPLHQKIFDLLLRFRMHLIAITADIEKAFLMVGVSKPDQDVLRFLWSKDVQSPVQIYKFTRVVFGVGPSPYLLNATIAHHLELFKETYPSTVSKLQESMYVDDVVMGSDNLDTAFSLCMEAREIFAKGSFNLRKFCSNNADLQRMLEVHLHGCVSEVASVLSKEQKVLGVSWDISSDEMLFDLTSIWEEATTINPTKRNVVSLVSKIYDPLGLMAPVVIRLKIFFQELSKCKLEWDEELSLPLKTKWKVLVDGLKGDPMRVSRYCFASVTNTRLRLVGFCDASTKAYAAVVYLVNERSESIILAAKTRVSPLQTQTVPRLELMGALILAKLVASVRDAMRDRVRECMCFTDSTIVLHWIKGTDKCWKPFVQNRFERG